MKAIGIVGSPRKNGNTEILTKHTLKAIAEEGLDTELIRLAGLNIQPCNACMVCRDEERCPIDDDLFPLYIKIKEAEAVKTVVGTEEFPLPNCGGTSELSQSLGTQTTVQKSVAVGAKATTTVGGEVDIPQTVKMNGCPDGRR